MQTTKDNSANSALKPITAEEIVNDILFDDDPENIREVLHDMVMAVFVYADPDKEFRDNIHCAYLTLCSALKKMEQLNPRRKEVKS